MLSDSVKLSLSFYMCKFQPRSDQHGINQSVGVHRNETELDWMAQARGRADKVATMVEMFGMYRSTLANTWRSCHGTMMRPYPS